MPTLILLRHAKSDWPANTRDLDRPLSERGLRDCAIAGAYLAKFSIDHAVVSPALRTQQTFDAVSKAYVRTIDSNIENQIYEAHIGDLLSTLHAFECETLLMVGHSPGMPHLALTLADDFEDESALRIRKKYPTCAIAVLTSEMPFSEWTAGCARLIEFNVPRANPESEDND
jgi:phosphohistidine phosphatase